MTAQTIFLHLAEVIVVLAIAGVIGFLVSRILHKKNKEKKAQEVVSKILKQDQKFIIDGKSYDLQSSVKEQRDDPAISPSNIKEKVGSSQPRKWYNPFTWRRKSQSLEESDLRLQPNATNSGESPNSNDTINQDKKKEIEEGPLVQDGEPKGYNPTKRVMKGG